MSLVLADSLHKPYEIQLHFNAEAPVERKREINNQSCWRFHAGGKQKQRTMQKGWSNAATQKKVRTPFPFSYLLQTSPVNIEHWRGGAD
jgi:hypothetical protein